MEVLVRSLSPSCEGGWKIECVLSIWREGQLVNSPIIRKALFKVLGKGKKIWKMSSTSTFYRWGDEDSEVRSFMPHHASSKQQGKHIDSDQPVSGYWSTKLTHTQTKNRAVYLRKVQIVSRMGVQRRKDFFFWLG